MTNNQLFYNTSISDSSKIQLSMMDLTCVDGRIKLPIKIQSKRFVFIDTTNVASTGRNPDVLDCPYGDR